MYPKYFYNEYKKCLRGGLNPPKGLTFHCLRGGFALLQGALLTGNFNKEIKRLKLGLYKTIPYGRGCLTRGCLGVRDNCIDILSRVHASKRLLSLLPEF